MIIDGDALLDALQTGLSDEAQFYLNTETGTITMVFGGTIDGDDMDEDEIEAGPFTPIEPLGSRAGYQIMEDLVEQLPDGIAKTRLEDSLGGKGAFRRFQDRLDDYPAILKQWYRFRDMA